MAKTYLNQAKYIIRQSFEIKGVVDKHDIIGAIFGQSEGLIGEDLDIRELQSAGKIGRIELELASEKGITKGTLTIPSGADMVETAILAATIEVVDKVGPCDAFFKTDAIEDTRGSKRKLIVNRAKELLTNILNEEIPDSLEITNEVRNDIQTSKAIFYGPDKLSAGPTIDESEEIILVEGRADVLTLLKYNIKNVIAMGGSKIPQSIVDLTKKKTTIAFLDGDRGGVLDLKKLLQIAEIDFIARAPMGLEVEELTKKQILAALNKKIPVAQTKPTEDLGIGEKYWSNENKDLINELNIEVHEKVIEDNPKKEQSYNSYQSNYSRGSYHRGRYERKDYRRDYRKYEPHKNEYKTELSSQTTAPEKKANDELVKDVFEESKPKVSGKKVKSTIKANIKRDRKKAAETKKAAEPIIDFPLDVKKNMSEMKNKFCARFFDKDGKLIKETKVKDVLKQVKDQKNCAYLLFDGIITKRVVELSKSRGIKAIVGSKKGKMDKVKGIDVIEYDA